MKLLFSALAIAAILEGLPYLAAPARAREVLVWLCARSDDGLRLFGLAFVLLGTVGLVLLTVF